MSTTIGHKVLGQGPHKVIALHPWLSDHTIFEPMFNYLDLEQFTYVFMDYRGYGQSKDLEGDHTLFEIAQDVINLADHLGFKQFHLLGNSMGGQVSQYLAGKYPKRIVSAILLNPVPASGSQLLTATSGEFPKNVENRSLFRSSKNSGLHRC